MVKQKGNGKIKGVDCGCTIRHGNSVIGKNCKRICKGGNVNKKIPWK